MAMGFFIANYDYGTGSTFVGILAESASQIETELKFMTVVDPISAQIPSDLVQRLEASARPIDDKIFDDIRKPRP